MLEHVIVHKPELFWYERFTDEQQLILDGVTTVQDYEQIDAVRAYYCLAMAGQINRDDYDFNRFNRLLQRGLYGGVVSWHVEPSEPVFKMYVPDEHRTRGVLMVRSVHPLPYLDQVCRKLGLSFIQTGSRGFSAWHLYMALKGMGPTATVLGLTDYSSGFISSWDETVRVLRKMATMRLARKLFNEAAKDRGYPISWELTGMYAADIKGTKYRRLAKDALYVAGIDLKSKSKSWNRIGLTKRQVRDYDLPYDEYPDRAVLKAKWLKTNGRKRWSLSGMSPTDMETLIESELVKVERVPESTYKL